LLASLSVAFLDNFDRTEMLVHEPAHNVEVAALNRAVNRVHNLNLLVSSRRKWAAQVDVSSVIELDSFVEITLEKCLSERVRQVATTSADLHYGRILEIIRLG